MFQSIFPVHILTPSLPRVMDLEFQDSKEPAALKQRDIRSTAARVAVFVVNCTSRLEPMESLRPVNTRLSKARLSGRTR